MKVKLFSLATALTLLAGLAVGAARAQDGGTADAAAPEAKGTDEAVVIAEQLPSYPLESCVVSEEGLYDMGEPVNVVQDGTLVRLCCKGCKRMLSKDPAQAVERVQAAVVAAQKESYPLKTCVVSGEGLGSMGEPVEHVDGTRLVRLCCKGCKRSFAKTPERFLGKVDEALIESQKDSYALKSCPVSGKALDGALDGAHDFLYGTQLVRTCCPMCEKKFRADGETMIAKVRAAKQ